MTALIRPAASGDTANGDAANGGSLDLVNEIPDKASRGQQPLADLVKKDIARWTQIIKAAGAGG